MRYGYMSGGGYGGIILMVLILLAALAVLFLIIRSLNRGPSRLNNPRRDLIIEILKHRYVTNEISADQYIDMKGVVEAESLDSPELLALKERFARGELSAEDYWQHKSRLHTPPTG